jgi:hypothetical protein
MGAIKLPHASGNSMSIAAPATNPASDLELKLPATIGTANQLLRNGSTPGTLEFGGIPVLQIVESNLGTAQSLTLTSSNTFYHVSSMDQSITTKAANSKILILWQAQINNNSVNHDLGIQLRRTTDGANETILDTAATPQSSNSNGILYNLRAYGTYSNVNNYHFIDSASASAGAVLQYKTYAVGEGQEIHFGKANSSGAARHLDCTNHVTLIEVLT